MVALDWRYGHFDDNTAYLDCVQFLEQDFWKCDCRAGDRLAAPFFVRGGL